MPLSSSIATRLHYQHKSIVDMIDGLSDEMVRRQVITGKWSVFENLVHLQTYQHTFLTRMRELAAGNNPVFARYTAEADPLFHDNCSKSIREIIKDLLSIRKNMLGELSALGELDLVKTAVHPVFGKMDLAQWLDFFLLHEAHHMFGIFKMAAQLKSC